MMCWARGCNSDIGVKTDHFCEPHWKAMLQEHRDYFETHNELDPAFKTVLDVVNRHFFFQPYFAAVVENAHKDHPFTISLGANESWIVANKITGGQIEFHKNGEMTFHAPAKVFPFEVKFNSSGDVEDNKTMSVFCHHPTPCPPTAKGRAARVFKPGTQFTHLHADTEQELINYAKSIGMNPAWIQHKGTSRVHFDVSHIFLNKVLKDDRVEKLDHDAYVRRVFPEHFEDEQ